MYFKYGLSLEMGFIVYQNIYFSTFTIYRWQNLLQEEVNINIILEAFTFLSNSHRWILYAFVIMPNHIHLFYQVLPPHLNENIKHSFLSYTSKKIIRQLSIASRSEFFVSKSDRKFQIWKSPSLSVEITSPGFVAQKMDYIHDNPRRAGLINENIDYKYCSYASYEKGESMFSFLTLW
jgi:REP element-mobilizing transposase RayT